MIEYLMWLVTAVSFLGAHAVNNKKSWGFTLWIATNVLCVAYNLHRGSYSQVFKYMVFACMAGQGLWNWTRKTGNKTDRAKKTGDSDGDESDSNCHGRSDSSDIRHA